MEASDRRCESTEKDGEEIGQGNRDSYHNLEIGRSQNCEIVASRRENVSDSIRLLTGPRSKGAVDRANELTATGH